MMLLSSLDPGGHHMPGKRESDREVRRIKVSDKRQITIPVKFYEQLGIQDEVECYLEEGRMVIRPVKKPDDFSVEILEDLVKAGYHGEELLREFKRIRAGIRPAVERLIQEADEIAEKALKSKNRKSKTEELFGDLED